MGYHRHNLSGLRHAQLFDTDRGERWTVRLGLSTALVAMTALFPAQAQDLALQTRSSQQVAQSERVLSFDIAAQPLRTALSLFGRQGRVQVSVSADQTEGIQTAGIKGEMTVGKALTRLLDGTGLTWHFAGPETVVLVAQVTGEGLILDPVHVGGVRETSWSPVQSTVAHVSATGSKTDTPISEVPQSISVITRQDMDQHGGRSVGDMLGYSAGVIAGLQGDSAGLGGDNISIRGFGGDGVAGASENEFWDGLRMKGGSYVDGGLDPFVLERVEVLRGPSSVLYGQNQPGGVINQVTKRPTETAQGEIQIAGSSRNRRELAVDLSGPVDSAKGVSYRLIGVQAEEDGQTDFSGLNRQVFSPNVTIRPNDAFSLTVQAVYQHDDVDGKFWKPLPADGTLFDTANGKISRDLFTGDPNYDEWDRELYSLGYFADYTYSDTWTFRQNARYQRNDVTVRSVYMTSLRADGRTINRVAFGNQEVSDTYTLDNQAQARFKTGTVDHTLLMGVDYLYNRADTLRRLGVAPTLDLYNPVYYQTIATPSVVFNAQGVVRQLGGYLQDQLKIDQWIVTLGGRYDRADSKLVNLRTQAADMAEDDAFSGRAGLGYAFEFGLTPYASFAQSFDPQTGSDISGKAFEPTTGEQYEVGLKYEPVGTNARLTAAAYQLTQQNVLTTDPNNAGYSVQTGEVRSRGLELEAVADLESGWNFSAAYTLIDAEVTKSNDVDLGKRPTLVPEYQVSLWGRYSFRQGPLDGFGVGAGVRHIGSSMGNNTNTIEVPEYTVYDLAASYDLGALASQMDGTTLMINANNVTDETYVASCRRANACSYGAGRTVTARMSYKW